LITNHCPHFEDTPVGEFCERCEQEDVGIVELDADGEGVVTFLVPLSQGLTLQELRELVPQEVQDETLLIDLVGDMWSRATLYVVPEGSEVSWTLLRTSPEEVRGVLEG
jgi:hypothetical protein